VTFPLPQTLTDSYSAPQSQIRLFSKGKNVMFKNKLMLLIASGLLGMPVLLQAQGTTPTAAGKGNTVGADQIVQRYASFAGGEANAKSLVNGLRNGVEITLSSTEEKCTQYEPGACVQRDPDTCSAYNDVCTTGTKPACAVSTFPPGCTVGSPGCICPQPTTTTTTTCVAGTSSNGATCKTLQQGACTKYAQGACSKTESQTSNLKFQPGPAAPMGFGNVDIALALTEAALRPNATPQAAVLKDKLLEILDKRAGGDGWGKIARSYGLQLQE
jgi:hypothetical protein